VKKLLDWSGSTGEEFTAKIIRKQCPEDAARQPFFLNPGVYRSGIVAWSIWPIKWRKEGTKTNLGTIRTHITLFA